MHVHYAADGTETGRTVVTREPEWDDDAQEWAVQLLSYQAATCQTCGAHYSQGRRTDVGRDVQQATTLCLDCDAIERAREDHHRTRGHTDDNCDCGDFSWYVADYPKYLPTRR